MNKQVKQTGKQPLPPATPKTETGKDKDTKNFTDKEQDNQKEIQRQKRNPDEDFEEKDVKGTQSQKTSPGLGDQQKKQEFQTEQPQDEEEEEDTTEEEDDEETEEDEERERP